MAMTGGYNEYACDVRSCECRDFAQPDTDKADSYVRRRRYDDGGVEREIMLCAEHNATYARLVRTCEEAYQAFERDGSYALATQEEVAELQATIAELQATIAQMQADYDALRRNRDLWVTKYNALEAEYEQYKRDHPDTEGGDE